jgi:hypothetical protein
MVELLQEGMNGNTAALIFLAKNCFGMRDNPDVVVNVAQTNLTVSEDTKRRLWRLRERARSRPACKRAMGKASSDETWTRIDPLPPRTTTRARHCAIGNERCWPLFYKLARFHTCSLD